MKPGPELDAAVAAALGGEYLDGIASVFWPDGSCEEWKPSTTWNGAGLVAARMVAMGFLVDMGMDCTGPYAQFKKAPPDLYFQRGQTIPYAICLAALAALEER